MESYRKNMSKHNARTGYPEKIIEGVSLSISRTILNDVARDAIYETKEENYRE